MTPVLVTMSIVLVVAVLALGYAAFPHRGESLPGAPWLSDVLERASDAVPTVADGDLDDPPVPAEPVEPVDLDEKAEAGESPSRR